VSLTLGYFHKCQRPVVDWVLTVVDGVHPVVGGVLPVVDGVLGAAREDGSPAGPGAAEV